MPRITKLGKYDAPPRILLSNAVTDAKKIVARFKDNAFTDHELASALGHDTAKSGAFRQRVADLRRYGLVDGRGSTLRASATAQALYAKHPGDYEKAVSDTAFRIPLFRDLHTRFEGSIPADRDLLATLIGITGAPRPELENQLGLLAELYKNVSSTLSPMAQSSEPANRPFERTQEPPIHGKLLKGSGEEFEFSVLDKPEAIDRLIRRLIAEIEEPEVIDRLISLLNAHKSLYRPRVTT
jgi:hypothetical protein